MSNQLPLIQREKRVWYTNDNRFGMVGEAMDGVYLANGAFKGGAPDPGCVYIRPDESHMPFEYDPNGPTPTASSPGEGWRAAVVLPNADPTGSEPLEVKPLYGVEVVTPVWPMENVVAVPVGYRGAARVTFGRTPPGTLTLEQKFKNASDSDSLFALCGLPDGVTVVVDWILGAGGGVVMRDYFLHYHARVSAGPTSGDSDDPSTLTVEGIFVCAARVLVA